ncbi:nitroreductase family protein [uncultured Bacteroides sp.]|uniref:nitroreductase family protein n=1 Tax=uncultured Bacteroides sp. TaxID=162156 RepID=UPI002AA6A19D|nr:nitroreductase family protein [uncultured Bacteroides sp.]
MTVPTSRTNECGRIQINSDLCNGCGLCVSVCKDYSLTLENNKAKQSANPLFGCLACGHCMMICPQGAITIEGRCTSEADLIEMPSEEESASHPSLLNLLYRRRSIREFKDTPVEKEVIDKIIEAAQTAPMGLPPSDVHLLVFDTQEKVADFAKDFCGYLEGMKWFVSKWFLALMRPFWGKANNDLFKGFVRPCVNAYIGYMKKGTNIVNYDAPVAMYFYGSPYSDPADPVIAATYAMIAAESLGLGTCMAGAVHPFIQNGKAAKRFREKYGIREKSREGLFVLMGYPKVKYTKAIKRTFASVDRF